LVVFITPVTINVVVAADVLKRN